MNIFKAIKENVSTRQAAEQYGIKVGSGGMVCCPFHKDRTPSMKIDRNFYCFGCGAKGDVIAFVAKLFDLSPKATAQKLATDFGLIFDETASHPAQKKPSEWELQKRYEQEENEMFWALAACRKQLAR